MTRNPAANAIRARSLETPHIPSDELTLEQVPDPDTCTNHELWDFAHSFNAYTHWGGLEEAHTASARAAAWQTAWIDENGLPEGEFYPAMEPELDTIRTDLFLDCRAERHCNQESEPSDTFWFGLREGVRAIRHRLTT